MKQYGKVKLGLLSAAAVVVLGGAMGGAGYWLANRDDSTDSTIANSPSTQQSKVAESSEDTQPDKEMPASTTSEPACAGMTYTNSLIGLEFCYPAYWGPATIQEPQASASDAGSGYEISFASKEVIVSAITLDYQNTVARGGRCEDPESSAPNFSLYSTSWVKDSADEELSAAVRFPLKQDDLYIVKEDVNSFFYGLCYSTYVKMSGTAYPVVKISLRRELGSTTVLQHTIDPLTLLPQSERDELQSVAESIRRP